MKYSFLALIAIFFFSCSDNNSEQKIETPVDYTAKNEADIKAYIAENQLNAKRSNSGLYYVINQEGTGKQPTAMSNVTVSYKGYFTDKKVFDQSTEAGATFPLQNLIKGWTEGIPFFKEGGSGILLIPAHLGYGSSTKNGIPSGSVLIF